MRAGGPLAVRDARIVSDEQRGVVQVLCAGPDEEQGSAAVSIGLRNDGALPVSLGEAETLQGPNGPVATVSYLREGSQPGRRSLLPPGGRVDVVLDLTVAMCGPGHNEATTSTISQVTLPMRSLGVASTVVVDLPTQVTVPGLVDITPLDPFGCGG